MKDINPEFILCVKNNVESDTKDEIIADLKLKVVEGQDEINYWRAKLDKSFFYLFILYILEKIKKVSKKRMRVEPKNVKPQGKITKFNDDFADNNVTNNSEN